MPVVNFECIFEKGNASSLPSAAEKFPKGRTGSDLEINKSPFSIMKDSSKNPDPVFPPSVLLMLRKSRNWLAGLASVGHAFSAMLIIGLWLALGVFVAWDARTELRRARTQTDTLADAIAAHTSRVLSQAEDLAAVVAWQVQKRGLGLPLSDYTPPGSFKLDAFEKIAVIDRDGTVRSSTAPRHPGVDVADSDQLRSMSTIPARASSLARQS